MLSRLHQHLAQKHIYLLLAAVIVIKKVMMKVTLMPLTALISSVQTMDHIVNSYSVKCLEHVTRSYVAPDSNLTAFNHLYN